MSEPKDGVYEWPTTFPSVTSSPLLAFSSVKTTSSKWHFRLDDIIIIGTNTNIIQCYIDLLAQRFSIKDLGVLSYFLGIEVLTTPSSVLLTQRRYISDLLARTKMSSAKPVAKPLVIDGNLTLHSELGVTLPTLPVIYCDNVGATYFYSNPVFHSRMKHVAINYYFIQNQVQSGALRVTHVSSADQLANALTKPLLRSCFHELQIKMGVSSGAPS
ncbi:Retrovirus-related Pol polyprotein from transposon RE1 [Vitis vinifera]|uniref:Retrovirus-related Pol polyprotein from transposon RE1 n=1 Tax=Vitis vinifera TaxID=29760 RepID=A0A438GLG2_VITVI|nr:Retrovirus-related Pol polyprotein from transposon RE1 [Vitis vinifera]